MFVIKVVTIEKSCHSLEVDALTQKQRLVDSGISESDILVVEQVSFNPPYVEL